MPTLTALSLQQYKPHPTKRREIRDHGARGLFLVVQPKPTGSRSWALRFRDARGKSAKLALGPLDITSDDALSSADDTPPQVGSPLTLSDARLLACMLHREMARGVDVVDKYVKRKAVAADGEANGVADSFKALAIAFVRQHKTKRSGERPRRWRSDARLLGLVWDRDADPTKAEPEVLPGSLCDVWGSRPVRAITRHEIEDVVADARTKAIPGLEANNPGESENRARKAFAILSSFFSWLARRRHIDADVTTAIEAPMAPKARKRILAGSELRWCWQAAGSLPFPYGPLTRLLLATGQRLAEVGGLRRSELNEDASSWLIPGSRTKNHREHLLPLPVLAREIITAAPVIAGRDLVFSVTGVGAPTGWSHAKHALDEAMAEIARKEGRDVKIERFVLHDLRRSFASGLQHIGIAPQVIERALNHSSGPLSGGIAAVYQVDPLIEDVRAALSSWARYLQLVTDKALHDAHEAYLLQGDDDQRARALQRFRDCVGAGGDVWQGYLDQLAGTPPPKIASLTAERSRRRK
jgi:integrase